MGVGVRCGHPGLFCAPRRAGRLRDPGPDPCPDPAVTGWGPGSSCVPVRAPWCRQVWRRRLRRIFRIWSECASMQN